MDVFRCGHPKSPENTVKNGGSATRCKKCKNLRFKQQYYADIEVTRLQSRERARRSRGVRGSWNGRKAECPKGHIYSDENTYWYGKTRQCKECRRNRSRQWHYSRRANGGSHTQEEWVALCESYGNHCLRCGKNGPLTEDHVLPLSKGGTNDIGNIQPLCGSCNSGKKDRHIDYRPNSIELSTRSR